jgi:hypothetical protein
MTSGMTVDTREFDAALQQYAAVSKKDHADIVNHQLRNLAIHALKGTKKAQSSAIRAMRQVSWWPKYIAGIIAKRGTFFSATQASRVYQSYWAKGLKGAMGRKMTKQETEYQKMARKISSQVFRQRTGAITFLRGFFWKMQQALAPVAPGENAPQQSAIFRNTTAMVSPATPGNLRCTATSRYNYKFRSQKTAAGAERELYKVLAAAYPETARDMQVYITRKLQATAKRFSGRRAA